MPRTTTASTTATATAPTTSEGARARTRTQFFGRTRPRDSGLGGSPGVRPGAAATGTTPSVSVPRVTPQIVEEEPEQPSASGLEPEQLSGLDTSTPNPSPTPRDASYVRNVPTLDPRGTGSRASSRDRARTSARSSPVDDALRSTLDASSHSLRHGDLSGESFFTPGTENVQDTRDRSRERETEDDSARNPQSRNPEAGDRAGIRGESSGLDGSFLQQRFSASPVIDVSSDEDESSNSRSDDTIRPGDESVHGVGQGRPSSHQARFEGDSDRNSSRPLAAHPPSGIYRPRRTPDNTSTMAAGGRNKADMTPLELQNEGLEATRALLQAVLSMTQSADLKESLTRQQARMDDVIANHKKGAELAKRERSTQLFTTLPTFGDVNTLPDAKTYAVPNFGGHDNKKRIPCLNWLQRVCNTVTNNNLSENAAWSLLDRHSEGEVMVAVDDARREHLSFDKLIHQLEARFGGVVNPDQAHYELGELRRRKGETFSHLHTRIRNVARMAVRDDREEEQVAKELLLSKQAFIRCLPREYYLIFKDEERQRNARGEPDFQYAEMITEITRIEKQLHVGRPDPQTEKERAFLVQPDESESQASPDKEPETEQSDEQLVDQLFRVWEARKKNRFQRRKGFRQKGAQPRKRMRDKVFQVLEGLDEEVALEEQDDDEQGDSDESPLDFLDEPINLVQDDGTSVQCILQVQRRPGGRPNYTGLNLTRLNVKPGQCARCGLMGHYCSSDKCPLGKTPIKNYACTVCNTGGHDAKVCPTTKNVR